MIIRPNRSNTSNINPFEKAISMKRGFNKSPEEIINERNKAREISVTKFNKQRPSISSSSSDSKKMLEAMKNMNRFKK